MAKVLSGDTEAYGEIIGRYTDVVFGVVRAMVRNHHTAEDLTQETFTDGYMKLGSLGEPYNVGAWLVVMAKNKCRNYLTRSAARFESELHDRIPDARTSSPENFLVKQEERRMLKQALRRLPEPHKTAAIMYYYKDYSHNKIAELLDIPVGTVKSRLYDARSKLKKELDNMENMNIDTDTDIDMDMNDSPAMGENFKKQVREKIKAIQDYYSLHNNSYDGFENEFKETVALIDRIPESKEKHAAYADAYYAAYNQDKTHGERALREAELSENAYIMAHLVINYYLNNFNDGGATFAAKANEIAAKIRKMPENPENNNALGELLLWRGAKYFRDAKSAEDTETSEVKFSEAKADFIEAERKLRKDNAYHPNAAAGIKAVGIELVNASRNICAMNYAIDGEQLRYRDDGKILFVNQPGFSTSSSNMPSYGSIFFFVSSNDSTFFDENMGTGEENSIVFNGDYIKGSILTLISKNEKAAVIAGGFDNCLHIKLKGTLSWEKEPYTADVYYAKGVGLVKASFTGEKGIENYELCEYKINDGNAGSEYFPFAVGNTWRYADTNLPSVYFQFHEREIISINARINAIEYEGRKCVDAFFSALDFIGVKLGEFADDCDSDVYIKIADSLVNVEASPKFFDNAVKCLKFALRKNSSVTASLFAAYALKYLEKFRDYRAKEYRLLSSRLDSSTISKRENDKIIYTEYGQYSIPLCRMGTRHEENKIFGMMPFRYLHELAGTLYSGEWVSGYSERKKIDGRELSVKAEDGGTVVVKAGTFENCLKVTFDLALHEGKNYFSDYASYTCGTKIYYYAPDVGIVKHDCIWGDSLSSSCELTEYRSVSTDGEYMPVYVGSCWVYDETTLEPEYRARRKYDVVTGVQTEFIVISEQEFLYPGTKAQYEEFKRSIAK